MITKNYIKMCEQAHYIQKAWKPEIGDRMIWKELINSKEENYCSYVSERIISPFNKEYYKRIYIWLPTQEQLQEIATPSGYVGFSLIELFYRFTQKVNMVHNPSMNEIWLMYVMNLKYNKIWNGKVWTKE